MTTEDISNVYLRVDYWIFGEDSNAQLDNSDARIDLEGGKGRISRGSSSSTSVLTFKKNQLNGTKIHVVADAGTKNWWKIPQIVINVTISEHCNFDSYYIYQYRCFSISTEKCSHLSESTAITPILINNPNIQNFEDKKFINIKAIFERHVDDKGVYYFSPNEFDVIINI